MRYQWTKKKNEDFRFKYNGVICSKKGCTSKAHVRGMCLKCYRKEMKKRKVV